MNWFALILILLWPAAAVSQSLHNPVNFSEHWIGYLTLVIFLLAFVGIVTEEFTQLRKSKPVLMASGLIWIVVGLAYASEGYSEVALEALRENLLAYVTLMLFLLVTMTYVNALEERRLFLALRGWLVNRHFSYRQLYWILGLLAFFMSPMLDNLITVLLLGAIVMAVAHEHPRFVTLSCVNIVVASNAGGVFSPFGDVTSLLIWQSEKLAFNEFLPLFLPSLVAFILPAYLMQLKLPSGRLLTEVEVVRPLRGVRRILILFVLTVLTTITFHYVLHLPPVIGMLTGLSYLQLFGFYLKKTAHLDRMDEDDGDEMGVPGSFDVFSSISRVEWDTLLFFYGVMMCVGGIGFIGYLALLSDWLYGGIGASISNISIGLLSAVFDSIPMMYGVLIMNPSMDVTQWQLVTLVTGIGGSILSIGSAGGVALMGQARGFYTFFAHLRWMPAILLGYAVSVVLHLWLNAI